MRDRAHRLRVYPRVGGETAKAADIHVKIGGLSPRGRGNHFWQSPSRTRFGSIPAWAGKPASLFRPLSRLWVYPRVGGETTCSRQVQGRFVGLSPRGRGNQQVLREFSVVSRSIPAWAGKPHRRGARRNHLGVYPRVGGETLVYDHAGMLSRGLSPRGRGNLAPSRPTDHVRWSIPAWAGKPYNAPCLPSTRVVYPRVGGETVCLFIALGKPEGLSPRGRGNLCREKLIGRSSRSIPAWAGKPFRATQVRFLSSVYPRVGGETGARSSDSHDRRGLSPRGRGNPWKLCLCGGDAGSIPAWAGKPRACRTVRRPAWVYPRVGGETRKLFTRSFRIDGLSPRGRGNLITR